MTIMPWRLPDRLRGHAKIYADDFERYICGKERDGGWKPRLGARYRPAEEKGLWEVSDTTRQLRPTPLALSSAPPPLSSLIRFSKQWCRGHLDLWVIEESGPPCQARRLKIHRTLSPALQVGGKWLFPSMSKPKNNHQRRDLLESTRTSFPSLAMTTAKTKSKRVDIFGHRRQSFTRTLKHCKTAQKSPRKRKMPRGTWEGYWFVLQ